MPIVEMMVDSAAGHEYLSLLDGYSGYNQIFIAKEDVSKTAFRCPGALGTYEWVYIDDIVVKSPSRDDHLLHLRKSFERMRKHGLKVNPLKCAFGVITGDFLGFVVHKKGIEINKNKAKAILDTSPPNSKKKLQSLLGKINFLRRFIANLSEKTKPFSPLLRLKKEETFRWEAEHHKAFDELKEYLSSPPVMIPPIRGKPMRLYISATDETIGSLEILLALGAKNVIIKGDSELVIKQLTKEYKCVSEDLARKVKYRALSYTIMGNELFKKNVDETLLKCLSEDDAFVAILVVHDGLCCAHQARAKMKWILFRQGMYWPTITKDCIKYAKGCQDCQKHAGIQHVPASELHSIIKPWPFRGWALDLIGEINPSSSRKHKYIIVAIDYFTKWVEAIPLQNVTQETVIDFIQNHNVYRFGLPESLTTDPSTMFVGRKVAAFTESWGIKLLTSTPYYAQANGQVEAANKTLISLIKKHVGRKPKSWHETLGQILWAYQNLPREATGATPFRLAYGQEAVLPAEVYLQSCRIQRQEEIPSEDCKIKF
ncbi:uncharacterized protein LOC130744532 [Lotus japonicus]|uniref:uncharacterized protein LOC130744532 n=1 Tax=Lotus japonicus TaxID=34305 RepID=UPI002583ADF7|nr:uncharacterized protein LOC130744532 [Lotus japonicus]